MNRELLVKHGVRLRVSRTQYAARWEETKAVLIMAPGVGSDSEQGEPQEDGHGSGEFAVNLPL